MQPHHVFAPLAIATALALSACGGGGDDAGSPTPTPVSDPTKSAGLYSGTMSNGSYTLGALLDDGSYWMVYTVPNQPQYLAGFINGKATSTDGTLRSSDVLDVNFTGPVFKTGSLSGTYTTHSRMGGTLQYNGSSAVTLTSTYETASTQPASLFALAGTFTVDMAFASSGYVGSDTMSLVIPTSGVFSGTTTKGCRISGKAVPRTGLNVFDLTITAGASPCVLPNATSTGVGFYDASTGKLFAAATTANRANVLLALGMK